MSPKNDFKNVRLAVDLIGRFGTRQEGVILVDRAVEPLGVQLPGGFVEAGENLEQAVARELRLKTHLLVADLQLYRPFSEPYRDTRGHVVTQVFTGNVYGPCEIGEKVKNVIFMKRDELESYKDRFAFDHYQILKGYFESQSARVGAEQNLPAGMQLWEVHYMGQYYDSDPRWPGTVPVDKRYFVLANTLDQALAKAQAEHPELKKKLGRDEEIVVRLFPLANLVAARDASRDGRLGYHSTTELSSVSLSLKADGEHYWLGVVVLPK